MLLVSSIILATVSALPLRLNLQKGDQFDFLLTVNRHSPEETGTLTEHVVIAKVQGDTITMNITLTRLSINGVDRTSDLKKAVQNQVIAMPWTTQAMRTGSMTPLAIAQNSPKDVLAMLAEGGLYLCQFPKGPVTVGQSYSGATTATGGCTNGQYTVREIMPGRVRFEITKIAMRNCTQVSPLEMWVSTTTGLPTIMRYSARGNKSGRLYEFEQKLANFRSAKP